MHFKCKYEVYSLLVLRESVNFIISSNYKKYLYEENERDTSSDEYEESLEFVSNVHSLNQSMSMNSEFRKTSSILRQSLILSNQVNEKEKKQWSNLENLDRRYFHVLKRRRRNSLKLLGNIGVAAATTTSVTGSQSFLLPHITSNTQLDFIQYTKKKYIVYLVGIIYHHKILY